MASGDIGYSDERFGKAVHYLALGEGDLRARLIKAASESVHGTEYKNPNPIPDDVLQLMEAFWSRAKFSDIEAATPEDLESIGTELLYVAKAISFASRSSFLEVVNRGNENN